MIFNKILWLRIWAEFIIFIKFKIWSTFLNFPRKLNTLFLRGYQGNRRFFIVIQICPGIQSVLFWGLIRIISELKFIYSFGIIWFEFILNFRCSRSPFNKTLFFRFLKIFMKVRTVLVDFIVDFRKIVLIAVWKLNYYLFAIRIFIILILFELVGKNFCYFLVIHFSCENHLISIEFSFLYKSRIIVDSKIDLSSVEGFCSQTFFESLTKSSYPFIFRWLF